MKHIFLISSCMALFLLFGSTGGFAADQDLPLINGKRAVASVNNEPITIEELNMMIGTAHAKRTETKKAGRIDYSAFLDRTINMRLLVIEGRNIGFDQLPDIKAAVAENAQKTLVNMLIEQHLKDVQADEDEIQRIYGELAKEWKIKGLKFKNENDAKNVEAWIKGGDGFEDATQKAVEQGIAEGGQEEYLNNKDLTPAVAQLVSKMDPGSTSPIVSVGKQGYIIFKLIGTRLPETEDAQSLETARLEALNQKRVRMGRAYYEELKQRYLKVDENLFNSLDYEADTPGFEKLLKDERVLVEVMEENPITVAEFSAALQETFYHGMEIAKDSKRINAKKKKFLESMLQKRVLTKEARAQGIDKSEAYKDKVKDYENSLIFGAFINKVIAPDIQTGVEELKTYHQKNSREYTTPEMMRIKSLVFAQKGDAVEAIEKLSKGTDFNWLSSHAKGQVDKKTQGLLKFEGELLTVSSLPEDLQKIVSDVKPGDFRLYSTPAGHYVLYVYHVVAPQLQPFENVRKEIAKKVYNDKLNKAIEVWSAKLKEYYPVKIYSKDLKK